MNVARFMTVDPLVVAPDTSLQAALQLMDDAAIRHLPVVADGELVGLLSERDLLGETGWRVLGGAEESGARRVASDVMRTDVVTAAPDDLVVAAAVEVATRGIGCLPVMKDGALVGIVSELDFLRLVAATKGENDPPVSQVGSPRAATLGPDATLADVDAVMQAKGCRHVPIVQGGELVGMLSDRDLRRASGAGLEMGSEVEPLMSRDVARVHEDAPVSSAAELMAERKIGALVTTGGEAFGIVTSTDVLDHALGVLGGTPHGSAD